MLNGGELMDGRPRTLREDDAPDALLAFFGVGLWQEDALCAQLTLEEDEPQDRGSVADMWFSASTQKAKALCRQCPVRKECFDLALAIEPNSGVWAGFTAKEIRKMRSN